MLITIYGILCDIQRCYIFVYDNYVWTESLGGWAVLFHTILTPNFDTTIGLLASVLEFSCPQTTLPPHQKLLMQWPGENMPQMHQQLPLWCRSAHKMKRIASVASSKFWILNSHVVWLNCNVHWLLDSPKNCQIPTQKHVDLTFKLAGASEIIAHLESTYMQHS